MYRRELAQLREAERQRQLARDAAASATAGLPKWAWILMLVLGWNEIWSVLSNPVYLLLLLLIAVPLYSFLQLPQGARVARPNHTHTHTHTPMLTQMLTAFLRAIPQRCRT